MIVKKKIKLIIQGLWNYSTELINTDPESWVTSCIFKEGRQVTSANKVTFRKILATGTKVQVVDLEAVSCCHYYNIVYNNDLHNHFHN